MKKIYSQPSIQVTRIETSCMIAASNPLTLTAGDDSGSGELMDADATGAAMGRRGGSLWGDDADE